ncbi:hypothetical protein V6N12_049762 [Hibiscus sabdariffa]|uniref:Uncharacterized protein n=1 Tax=Hibiscus sabdariffa TaxID=183260 RepID=A0ABR2GAG7_9ROSI
MLSLSGELGNEDWTGSLSLFKDGCRWMTMLSLASYFGDYWRQLMPLVQTWKPLLLKNMKDTPNVADKACDALYFLAQVPSHCLSPRRCWGIPAAYETLNEVVRCSADETAPFVLQLVTVIMMELRNSLEGQKLSSDEREKQSELHGLLSIGALAYATGPDFAKYMPEFDRYLEMGLQE